MGDREVGFLNRKDVFYTGSITNVAEFKEDPDKYRWGNTFLGILSGNLSTFFLLKEALGPKKEVECQVRLFRNSGVFYDFKFWSQVWYISAFRSTGSLQRRAVSTPAAVSVDKLQEVREASEEVSEDTTTDNVSGSNMLKWVWTSSPSLLALNDPKFIYLFVARILPRIKTKQTTNKKYNTTLC